MSVDQTRVIDFIGVDKKSQEVNLFIADHYRWNDPKSDHLFKLQNKIYAYLDFIQSEEIYEKNPKYKNSPVIIVIIAKYPLDSDVAKEFLKKITTYVKDEGFDLRFEYKPFKN